MCVQGDLDGSGRYTSADHLVVDNSFMFPYGTTELFPATQDSDQNILTNSAHEYSECSNKGRCNRQTGECECFDGFDGIACQRNSCPGYPDSCSGHGVCKTIKQIAQADGGNHYRLWDKQSTMGCDCDKGYTGSDCSERKCRHGIDPMYFDDVSTIRYSVFDFAILSTSNSNSLSDMFNNGELHPKEGRWAIRFFDVFGEDWVTVAIKAGASCDEVVAALENLPTNVIPKNSLVCHRVQMLKGLENNYTLNNPEYDPEYDVTTRKPWRIIYKMAMWEARAPNNIDEMNPAMSLYNYTSSNDTTSVRLSGYIYRIKFHGNPGQLPEPQIELYLDGKRPALVSPNAKLITKVWTDGRQGESKDHVADICAGVRVRILVKQTDSTEYPSLTKVEYYNKVHHYLTGMDQVAEAKLKKCLGDSDMDPSNNKDIEAWDYGSVYYPHLIRLVRTVAPTTNGGLYAVVWFDPSVSYDEGSAGTFRMMNPLVPQDNLLTNWYDVYTTKGTLALVTEHAEATFGFGSRFVYSVNTSFDLDRDLGYQFDGDISCEPVRSSKKFKFIRNSNNGQSYCFKRSDMFTVLNWDFPHKNPPYLNFYTVQSVKKESPKFSVRDKFNDPQTDGSPPLSFMTNVITTDLSTNWAVSVGNDRKEQNQAQILATDSEVGLPKFRFYKFIPAEQSTYHFVSECANRGICDRDNGLCKCFRGYDGDACDRQSILAL